MLEFPKITDKQLDVLHFLYKFYFLNTNQFQILFKHKKPQTVQKWLKDLKDKGYVSIHDFNENEFIANTKPSVYHLTKLARLKLKDNKDYDANVLNRVYRIKSVSNEFVYNCVFLADMYIGLLSQMKSGQKLHFLTKSDLGGFNCLPSPLPDAYIAVKSSQKTSRFFLILLNPRVPWRILDKRITAYIDYSDGNHWADYSSDPLPPFLIVCPNEGTKKHLFRLIDDQAPGTPFYLASKDAIQETGFKKNVWQKVES